MIIVSGSGPLAYLVDIGVAHSLPKLYGQVYAPPTVMAELCHHRSPIAAWTNSPPDWLSVTQPKSIRDDLVLNQGEADFVLMDEKKGRTVARARGLKVAGTLAVILDGDA